MSIEFWLYVLVTLAAVGGAYRAGYRAGYDHCLERALETIDRTSRELRDEWEAVNGRG